MESQRSILPLTQRLKGKDNIKILFLRTPRQTWPFLVDDADNFLLPLAYPSLAAYLREKMDGLDMRILDCARIRMGYKSLERYMQEWMPDVVCIGEKTIYYKEGFKGFELARKVNPNVVNIAGGVLYSSLPKWTFEQEPSIDALGVFEGEVTLYEILKNLREGKSLKGVLGCVYREEDGSIYLNEARPLIDDLDSLPIPAYDIANVEAYQAFGKLWPRSATIQRGRGCPHQCNFCTWTVQEGQPKLNGDRYISYPRYRSKSVQRVLEEVEMLYYQHKVRYLFWVDATWNLDNEWLREFCQAIIDRGIKVKYWAFLRADKLVEQEEAGVLELMVKAGLAHTLIGVERATDKDLYYLNKGLDSVNTTIKAFDILYKKYPGVFRQVTVMPGLPDDTEEDIKNILPLLHRMHIDFVGSHPYSPFPGTPAFEQCIEEGLIEEYDFSKYDMFYPVMRTRHLSRAQVADATAWLQKHFVLNKPFRFMSNFLSPYSIRRKLYFWLTAAVFKMVGRAIWSKITEGDKFAGFNAITSMQTPKWYND